MISSDEYMKIWGEILGVKARFEEISVEEVNRNIPGGFGIELAEMMAYSAEFGYDGRDPSVIYPEDVSVFWGKVMLWGLS